MRFPVATIFLGLVLAAAGPAFGQDAGLSGLHAKVRVGSKLCFADHSHSGNSSGQPSRKAAEIEAIRNWQDFTALEYGSAWGRFSLAAGKMIECSGGSSWSCSVDARPCRGR